MVEAVVILFVFLLLIFGMLDLAVGVFRYHLVSNAARQGARLAIVHGKLAPPEMAEWGPATIDAAATATDIPIIAELQPLLIGMDLERTRITVEWLDDSNEVEKRVRVTVTTPYEPVTTFGWARPITLSATSTMHIAN